jgi:hypothetical protein
MAAKMTLFNVKTLQQGHDIIRKGSDIYGFLSPVAGLTVASQVHGDDPMRLRQLLYLLMPALAAATKTVYQDERLTCSTIGISQINTRTVP